MGLNNTTDLLCLHFIWTPARNLSHSLATSPKVTGKTTGTEQKWKADFGVFHNFSIFQTQKYVQSINLNSLNMKQKIKTTIFNWSDIFITLRKLLATWNIWPLLIIYNSAITK